MILYDKVLYPSTYLELMTGHYYTLTAQNQIEEVENLLDRECGKGTYWSYSLYDTKDVIESDKNVVLVEIVNIDDNSEQEKLYCWFDVPQEWDRKELLRRLSEL